MVMLETATDHHFKEILPIMVGLLKVLLHLKNDHFAPATLKQAPSSIFYSAMLFDINRVLFIISDDIAHSIRFLLVVKHLH